LDGRSSSPKYSRSSFGDAPSLIKQVFDGQGYACEFWHTPAPFTGLVNHVGLLLGAVMIGADKGTLALALGIINCSQTIVYQLSGADFTGVQGNDKVV
jgi:hypothetical protein